MNKLINGIPRDLIERAWRQLVNYDTGRLLGAYLDADPCAPECSETCVRSAMCTTCSAMLAAAPQPVSDAYRMAVDTGLVCAHIGVTNQEDDYETARKKLNDLICWSVQVDRDLGQPSDDARDALVEALEVLAKLGNGEHYGNSDGNVIAQMALAAYRAAMGSKGDE